MASPALIKRCFSQPVIPVVWNPSAQRDLIARASAVILEDGPITDLPAVLDEYSKSPLDHLALFVHIDLVTGLENNECGLKFLSNFPRIGGVVTVHQRLAKPASQLGLLSMVRLFLLDTRAMSRALEIAMKKHADAIELLPAVAAVQVADVFHKCVLPRIAGGLCQTEAGVQDALDRGYYAVTSSRPSLWQLNT